jgi:uridylate kinase
MEHDMPIVVFNYQRQGNIERAVMGERIGTLVRSEKKTAEEPTVAEAAGPIT